MSAFPLELGSPSYKASTTVHFSNDLFFEAFTFIFSKVECAGNDPIAELTGIYHDSNGKPSFHHERL